MWPPGASPVIKLVAIYDVPTLTYFARSAMHGGPDGDSQSEPWQ